MHPVKIPIAFYARLLRAMLENPPYCKVKSLRWHDSPAKAVISLFVLLEISPCCGRKHGLIWLTCSKRDATVCGVRHFAMLQCETHGIWPPFQHVFWVVHVSHFALQEVDFALIINLTDYYLMQGEISSYFP